MADFHIIGGEFIAEHLSKHHAVVTEIVKNTYLHHDNGNTENPNSYFLRFQDCASNRIIALPAAIYPEETAGIKWIASFPGNVEHNLQRASAVLILNSLATGYPYACLESSLISAYRTAASAVLGAYWMNGQSRTVPSIGFVGAGVIARTISDFFVQQEWMVNIVAVYDQHADSARNLVNHLRASGQHSGETSLEDVLACDIVVFATTAGSPYVEAPFKPHQKVLNISLRDIAPEVILASHNICDDVEHCLKASTSPHLAEQRVRHRKFIDGTLAGLMTGRFPIHQDKPTIFSPFGLGVLDLALGKYLCQQAIASGNAFTAPGFFAETSRW